MAVARRIVALFGMAGNGCGPGGPAGCCTCRPTIPAGFGQEEACEEGVFGCAAMCLDFDMKSFTLNLKLSCAHLYRFQRHPCHSMRSVLPGSLCRAHRCASGGAVSNLGLPRPPVKAWFAVGRGCTAQAAPTGRSSRRRRLRTPASTCRLSTRARAGSQPSGRPSIWPNSASTATASISESAADPQAHTTPTACPRGHGEMHFFIFLWGWGRGLG